jgi:hypothetical protein
VRVRLLASELLDSRSLGGVDGIERGGAIEVRQHRARKFVDMFRIERQFPRHGLGSLVGRGWLALSLVVLNVLPRAR